MRKLPLLESLRIGRFLASVWIVPAFVLSIIASMTAWFAYEEYQHTLETEYNILEAHARLADSQLTGLLRHIEQILHQIAVERPAIPAHALTNYAATVLTNYKNKLPEIGALAVINAAGRIEATTHPSLWGFNASQREYFTWHRDRTTTADLHISRSFKSILSDHSIAFSVAIRDTEGHFLGVVIAGVNYRFFEDVMTPILPPEQGCIASILNQEGDFLYRVPDPEKYIGINIRDSTQFQKYLNSGQTMIRGRGVARTDGVERIYVHQKIGSSGLGVSVGRPHKDIMAGWWFNVLMRTLIVGLAAAATLFLARLVQRRQREIASMECIRRNAEVAHRLVQIQEEERRRLAVELHDRTSPNLSALEINWKLFASTAHAPAAARASLLDDASALIDDTVESIRAISTEFHPPMLQQADFWPTLNGYVQHFSQRTGIAVQAVHDTPGLHLPQEIQTNLFRIVQEALTNCAKHSRAKTVNIGQIIDGDYIRLVIADDGTGFDPENPPVQGHGLRTMQSRAEFIGGRFSVKSQPGNGTHIAVEFKATDYLWQGQARRKEPCGG